MSVINQQTETERDLDHQLALVESQAGELADPNHPLDAILDELSHLQRAGVDENALSTIHGNTWMLLDLAEHTDKLLRGAVALAQRIKQQRDTTREALDRLRKAVEEVDGEVPEVAELIEYVGECEREMLEMNLWEYTSDFLIDNIVMNTPLSWKEAAALESILTGEGPALDHPFWRELQDWLAAVNRDMDIE